MEEETQELLRIEKRKRERILLGMSKEVGFKRMDHQWQQCSRKVKEDEAEQ